MMQKDIRAFITILIVVMCSLPAQAAVNALFLPDSGFLRVEGNLTVDPQTTHLSFLLFPNAQITMVWMDGLRDYSVDRGTLGTIVTLVVPEYTSPQELSFSYEGFIQQDSLQEITMDRDMTWFPEFSFPTEVPLIKLELPLEWHLLEPTTTDASIQDNFRTFAWKPAFGTYPEFTISPAADPADDKNTVVVTEPNTYDPTINFDEGDYSVQSDPAVDYRHQELMEFMTYFDELLNNREQSVIELILSNELVNNGLGQYLGALPMRYGTVYSEIISMYVREELAAVQAVIYAHNTPRFQTTMTLENQGYTWMITEFSMSPYTPTPPPELHDSLVNFSEQLREAVEAQSMEEVDQFLAMEGPARDQARTFLLSINADVSWNVRMASSDPVGLTLLIQHSPRTSLIVNFQLTPGSTGWQIKSLEAFPI